MGGVYVPLCPLCRVDSTNQGVARFADINMLGSITDDDGPSENPYLVVWDNGAWGFYSSAEIAEATT